MAVIGYKFLLIIFMILLGYVFRRTGVLKESDGDALTRFALNFTLPAVIISTFEGFRLQSSDLVYPTLGFGIGFVTLGLALLAFRRYGRREKGTLLIPMIGLNIGIFALPLVQVIWGDEVAKYLMLFDSGNSFIVFGLCYIIAAIYANDKGDANIRQIARSAIRSVPFLTYILTLTLRAFGVYYPAFLLDIARVAAKGNTPVAMIALGMFLSFRIESSERGRSLDFWLVKYLIGIAAGLTAFFCLPLAMAGRIALMIGFVMPPSFASLVYAVRFHYDTKRIGRMVNFSIIVSMALMMVMALSIPAG